MFNKTDVLEIQDFTNDETFQDLLRDLAVQEPGVLQADIYGSRGHKQYGIDILVANSDHSYLTIQAKCYKTYTLSDLDKAYQEFKKHVNRWQDYGVRIFIIAVSCKVSDPKIFDRVVELRKSLLQSAGITLGFWHAATINDKLKDYRAIAQKYIGNTSVVDLLCGKDPTEQAAFLAFKERDRLQVFSTQAQQWRDQQSQHEYQDILMLIRSGRSVKALEQLNQSIKSDDWNTRSLPSQAGFLRLQAQLLLDLMQDEVAAKSAAETALRIDPTSNDHLFAIRLLLYQQRADEALEMALGTDNPQALLQAAALLLSRDPQQALTLLNEISHPEHQNPCIRLKAIALSLLGQTTEALQLIENQAKQATDHVQLHLTWAQLLYFSVLSPALRRLERLQTVLPISQGLFQLTDQGIERIRKAQELTRQLLQWQDIDPQLRGEIALLHLATLAQEPSPARESHATGFLEEEIRAGRLTPEQALWAIQNNWKIDLERHLPAFDQSGNPNGPLAMIALYEQQGRIPEALTILKRHEAMLRQCDENVYKSWHERLQPQIPTTALSVLTRALAAGELACAQLDAFLAGTGELGDAVEILRRSHPQALLERADRLVMHLATPAILFICVMVAVQHKDYRLARRLWVTYEEMVSGAFIPGQVRRALSRMWFELGELPQALRDAEMLLQTEPCAYHQAHLIDLMVNMALTSDLRPHLEKLLTYPDLTVNQSLRGMRYAQAIGETRLAQRLLQAGAERVMSDLDVERIVMAQMMGGYPELPAIVDRFKRLMEQGTLQLLKLIKVEDFLAQLPHLTDSFAVYAQGDASIHHLYSGQPQTFASAYLEAQTLRPLYVRHGGIAPAAGDDQQHSSLKDVTRLSLDITALLLGARLGVLDLLSAEFEITLATDHVRDLTDMLAELPLTSPMRAEVQQIMAWIRERQLQGGIYFKPSDEERRHDHSAEILGFSALITCASEANERLCLDDRWAQEIALKHGRLITDSTSVLEELWRRGRLTAPDFYRLQQNMRRAQMRFLPITSEELVYWLDQADVSHGYLQETPDLAVIRQYYAGCFGPNSPLRPITLQGDEALHTGEMPFVLNFLHETRKALQQVFTTSQTPEVLADWLMEHLLLDMVAVNELPWGSHPHGRTVQHLRELELLSLASLDMHHPNSEKIAYYRWVNRKLIQPRVILDPTLGERFAAVWKSHVVNLLPPQHNSTYRVALGLLASDAETHIPVLHAAVTSDREYLKATGRNSIKLCLVHGRAFDMEKIWRVFLTLYGQSGKTTHLSDQSGTAWEWSLISTGEEWQLQATHEGDGFRIRIHEVWLALGKRKDREAHMPEIMRALPGLNSSDPRVKAMLREGNLTKRLEHFTALKSSTPSFFYGGLYDELVDHPLTQETARSDFLPEDPAVTLRLAGLETLIVEQQLSFQELLERAASAMLQQHGAVTAARRLANLPVEMPQVFRKALSDATPSLPELLSHIRGRRSGPLGLAHTVHFLQFLPGEEAKRLRKRLAAQMFTPEYRREMTALHRVLRWTFDQIQLRVPLWPVSAMVAATWLHAGEVYQQLRAVGYEATSIWQFFDQDRAYLPLQALLQSPDAPNDVALPLNLTPRRMLVTAFLHAASDLIGEFETALQDILLTRFNAESVPPMTKIDLIGSDPVLPNNLNSFMGMKLEAALKTFAWSPAELLRPDAAEVVFAAQKTPEDTAAIQPTLLYLAGRQKPLTTPVFSDALCKSLLDFDVSAWKDEVIMLGLLGAANLNNHVSESLEEKLLADLSQHLSTAQLDRELALQTFEILTALIRHPIHRHEELQHLAKLLDKIITPHSTLRKIIFPVVVRFAFECPAESASAFWPVLLRWRELGAQGELEWWAAGAQTPDDLDESLGAVG